MPALNVALSPGTLIKPAAGNGRRRTIGRIGSERRPGNRVEALRTHEQGMRRNEIVGPTALSLFELADALSFRLGRAIGKARKHALAYTIPQHLTGRAKQAFCASSPEHCARLSNRRFPRARWRYLCITRHSANPALSRSRRILCGVATPLFVVVGGWMLLCAMTPSVTI